MSLENNKELRWKLIEDIVKNVKTLLHEKKLTFGERFLVSDIIAGEVYREWNTTLLADWFSSYIEGKNQNVNIPPKPSYYQ